jgi:phospholipase C
MTRKLTRRRFLAGSSAAALLSLTRGLSGCSNETGGGGSTGAGATILRPPGSLPDPTRAAGVADTKLPFDNVVVVMMENHSFDNYFGMLPLRGQPKADGFRFDASGEPLNATPLGDGVQRAFRLSGTCQPNGVNQSWNGTHTQIDGGRMDGFARTDSEAMGYWDEPDIPFYYSLAKTFCLGNRYFASAPCQTYPNRRFLYAATASGLISTSTSTFTMAPPPNGTLMDVMSDHGVAWRSYFSDLPALGIIPQTIERHPTNFSSIAQFFVDAALGQLPAVSFVDPEFGAVDVVGGPLFSQLSGAPGLPAAIASSVTALANKVNAQGGDEENPQDISIGENFVSQIVQAVLASPQWQRTLLVWTYDEHGGYYDHVPPAAVPKPDDVPPDLGPNDAPGAYDITGLRIPTVVVSPYSRPNAVTDVVHDHTSVIATIASKWNLPALTWRDANATTLVDFLDLANPPAFLQPPALAAPGTPTLGGPRCQGSAPPPVIEPA